MAVPAGPILGEEEVERVNNYFNDLHVPLNNIAVETNRENLMRNKKKITR